MKKFLLVLAVILVGCDGPRQTAYKPFTDEQVKEVDSIIHRNLENFARCLELAKCLGEKGDVKPSRGLYYYDGLRYSGAQIEMRCVVGKTHEFDLDKVSAALEGCRNRKCGDQCERN